MIIYELGGDVKDMTKGAEISFTLRMPRDMSNKITYLAKTMGVSKNAYILMILHQSIENKNDNEQIA